MSDLNTLLPSDTGWELQAATAIADLNGIVGYGTFQGQTRAFMLTPAEGSQVDPVRARYVLRHELPEAGRGRPIDYFRRNGLQFPTLYRDRDHRHPHLHRARGDRSSPHVGRAVVQREWSAADVPTAGDRCRHGAPEHGRLRPDDGGRRHHAFGDD